MPISDSKSGSDFETSKMPVQDHGPANEKVRGYPERRRHPPCWPYDGTQPCFITLAKVAFGIIIAISIWLVFIREPRLFILHASSVGGVVNSLGLSIHALFHNMFFD